MSIARIRNESNEGGGVRIRISGLHTRVTCIHLTAHAAEVEVEAVPSSAQLGCWDFPSSNAHFISRCCCCTGTLCALNHGQRESPGWMLKRRLPTAVARIDEARESWNWRISVGKGSRPWGYLCVETANHRSM
jgi:hypothetical protein